MAAFPATELHILHFNDTYELQSEQSADEPAAGGVARFATVVEACRGVAAARGGHALLLHSGDVFSPSKLATATRGEHMVGVVRALGVAACCVGNHELDVGVARAAALMEATGFPWVLSNLRARGSMRPLCDAQESAVVAVGPWRVGLVGLVESNWVDTLATIRPRDVAWEEPLPCALRLARALREQGAHLVLALTHMRFSNDVELRSGLMRAEAEGGGHLVDAILGGHDHDLHHVVDSAGAQAASIPIIKSGCDFRWLSRVVVSPPPPQQQQQQQQHGQEAEAEEEAEELPGLDLPEDLAVPSRRIGAAPLFAHASPARGTIEVDLLTIARSVRECPAMAALVASKLSALDQQLQLVVGLSCVPLDVREAYVRRRETAVGNMMADLMRRSVDADVCLLNSGTLRGNLVLRPGLLRAWDTATILPYYNDTVVKVRVRGEAVLRALENSVSAWPDTDGRFCQVSGLRYVFDPNRPRGSRLLRESVWVLKRRRRWGAGAGAGAGGASRLSGGGSGGGELQAAVAAAASAAAAAARAAAAAAAALAATQLGAGLRTAAVQPASLLPPPTPLPLSPLPARHDAGLTLEQLQVEGVEGVEGAAGGAGAPAEDSEDEEGEGAIIRDPASVSDFHHHHHHHHQQHSSSSSSSSSSRSRSSIGSSSSAATDAVAAAGAANPAAEGGGKEAEEEEAAAGVAAGAGRLLPAAPPSEGKAAEAEEERAAPDSLAAAAAATAAASAPAPAPPPSSWEPLDPTRFYTVAIKHYLLMGKDGFCMFDEQALEGERARGEFEVLVPQASGHSLPALLSSHLEVLQGWGPVPTASGELAQGEAPLLSPRATAAAAAEGSAAPPPSSPFVLAASAALLRPLPASQPSSLSPRPDGAPAAAWSFAGGVSSADPRAELMAMAQSKVAPRLGGVLKVSSQQLLGLVAAQDAQAGGGGAGAGAAARVQLAPAPAPAPPLTPRASEQRGKEAEEEEEEEEGRGRAGRAPAPAAATASAAAAQHHPSALLPALPEYANTLSGVLFSSQNPLADIDLAAAVVEASPGRGSRSAPALGSPSALLSPRRLAGDGPASKEEDVEEEEVGVAAAAAAAAAAQAQAQAQAGAGAGAVPLAPLTIDLLDGAPGSSAGGGGPVSVYLSPIRQPPAPLSLTLQIPPLPLPQQQQQQQQQQYSLAIAPRVEGRITMLPYQARLAASAVCCCKGRLPGAGQAALVWGGWGEKAGVRRAGNVQAYLLLPLGARAPAARLALSPAQGAPSGAASPRALGRAGSSGGFFASPLAPGAGSSGGGSGGGGGGGSGAAAGAGAAASTAAAFRSPERGGGSGWGAGAGGAGAGGGAVVPSKWEAELVLAPGAGGAAGGAAAGAGEEAAGGAPRARALDSKGQETDEEGEGEGEGEGEARGGSAAGAGAALPPAALRWHRAWLSPSGESVLGTLVGAEGALVVAGFASASAAAAGPAAAPFFAAPGAAWGGAAWSKDGSTLYVTDSGPNPSIRSFDLAPSGLSHTRTRQLCVTPHASPSGCALDALDRLWVAHAGARVVCCYEVSYRCSVAVVLSVPRECPAGATPVAVAFGGDKWEELVIAMAEGGAAAVNILRLATGCAGQDVVQGGLLQVW